MAEKLHILQHSIGADKYGRRGRYSNRNHFVTGAGSVDHPFCLQLVTDALMTRVQGNEITSGGDLFLVTKAGYEFVRANSPEPPPEPKLTRSQKRYREWLNADPGYSFAEWIGVPRTGRRYA